MDGGEDGVPDFDEIAAACVTEDAEPGVGGIGGEHVADELVTLDDGPGGFGERSRFLHYPFDSLCSPRVRSK